jgi:tetratricopeptide (TPR) repeat protein
MRSSNRSSIVEPMNSSSAAVAKQLQKPVAVTFSASTRLPRSQKQTTFLLSLLLTVGVLVSYNPIIHNGFINFDDGGYITGNTHVKAGVTWPTVKWAFTTYEQANWHPLTWISHAFDCELFGLNPAGHHYVSVLLHAANGVLLFLLLQSATGFGWRSLMVAALFALHPVNVESVAWAAERKNVLSMLFFLLALYAYGWYARRPNLTRYAAVFGFFVLALLSKPQVITFPLLLCLWDYWPLCRVGAVAGAELPVELTAYRPGQRPRLPGSWLLLEKAPLLLLSFASALVTMKAQKAENALQNLSQYSLLLRLETAVIAYVRYVEKALWPSKLVALYPHPTVVYPAWQVGSALAAMALITGLVIHARDQRYLIVGWFWFLGSLIPMLGLVQVGVQAMADRYAYIPFVGLFLMLTWLAADLAKARHVSASWLAIPAAISLLALGTLSYRQVGYWHDTCSFWQRTLALTPNNYFAHDSLGTYLETQGETDEAAVHFRSALAIRPDDLPANLNLGTYEHSHGNLPAAIARYELVAQYAADLGVRSKAYANLGSVYRQMGDSTKAKPYFETAVQLDPADTLAIVGLGLIAEKNGDPAEAVRLFSRAMEVEPTDVGFLLLAHALQQEGKLDEAKSIRERVAHFSPNFLEAQKVAASLFSGK